MTLSRTQKLGIAFFILSLAPAYWIADWRYESKFASLTEMFEKEQALHLSTDKLLGNCEKIAAAKANPYDATHQICDQGTNIHEHTQQAMTLLTQEKASNETKWYSNFALTTLIFNLLAFFLYRASVFLKLEAN